MKEGLPKNTFTEKNGSLQREKTSKFVEGIDEENGAVVLTPERVPYSVEAQELARELNSMEEESLHNALCDLLKRNPDVNKEVAANLKKKIK